MSEKKVIKIEPKMYDLMEQHDRELDEALEPYIDKINNGEELSKLELQDIEQKRNMALIDMLNGMRGMR